METGRMAILFLVVALASVKTRPRQFHLSDPGRLSSDFEIRRFWRKKQWEVDASSQSRLKQRLPEKLQVEEGKKPAK